LGGGAILDETDVALASLGLVREGAEEVADEAFKVYAINWPTLTIFWATWNQWKKIVSAGNNIKDAIDWAQVESALKLSGIKRGQWPMIFEGLQAMEIEVLEILNRE
jgi:hypothetical protein